MAKNRLSTTTSPYLLQHASNPVFWEPWDTQAVDRAITLDRPILLSIGYSACHWCHVMEKESFTDPAIAEIMNREFVCIKVDREERPDIDAIYIDAVQAMTGSAGWPLHAFLTPKQIPFFGGTYFPPQPRPGTPSWEETLLAVARAWKDRRSDIEEQTGQIETYLQTSRAFTARDDEFDPGCIAAAIEQLRQCFDTINGGFGKAPKFPQAPVLEFLLLQPEGQPLALQTLRSMASGGIFDHIGGGFARYCVDAQWTVPHFEKMLYDNALLARTYLHGWQVSRDETLLATCKATLDWMLRDLHNPHGGFYSSLDADSEGEEGTFYVWDINELRELLDDDAPAAITWFGASSEGNFNGKNILESRGPLPPEAVQARIRTKLLAARTRRIHPHRDSKQIASWNALAITAFAEAGAALDEQRYIDVAKATAHFLLNQMRDSQKNLFRSFNDDQASITAFLDDYAHTIEALLTLYETTFESPWLDTASELADQMIKLFYDHENGGFFFTSTTTQQLIARRKELEDNPLPAGNSSAAFCLLRLKEITGEEHYSSYAKTALTVGIEAVQRFPQGFGHLLQAIAFFITPTQQIVLSGQDTESFQQIINAAFHPHKVVLHLKDRPEYQARLVAAQQVSDNQTIAYLCEDFTCQEPVTDLDALQKRFSREQ